VSRRRCRAAVRIGLAGLVLALVSCARRDVVAKVEGRPISFSEFETFVSAHAGVPWSGLEERVLLALFDQFLDEVLLARYAQDQGLVSAGLRREPALVELQKKIEVVDVDDEEVAAYAEAHPEVLRREERLVLGQLLVDERQTAEAVLDEVRANGSFEQVARSAADEWPGVVFPGYTDDVARKDLPVAFRELIFALPEGGVSEVVEAEYGFHLFHVLKRQPIEILSLAAARDEVVDRLRRERSDALLRDMLEVARRSYEVEVLERNLPFVWDVASRSHE
jgi:hypothetical protein